jgi:hypothetical protein
MIVMSQQVAPAKQVQYNGAKARPQATRVVNFPSKYAQMTIWPPALTSDVLGL